MAELEDHLRLKPRRHHVVQGQAQVTVLREMDSLGIHVRQIG